MKPHKTAKLWKMGAWVKKHVKPEEIAAIMFVISPENQPHNTFMLPWQYIGCSSKEPSVLATLQ